MTPRLTSLEETTEEEHRTYRSSLTYMYVFAETKGVSK